MSDLQDSIESLSVQVGAAIEDAKRVDGALVGAMVEKNERDLRELERQEELGLRAKEREIQRDVDRLRLQHESVAREVAQGQSSYNAMQHAADELRAKLAAQNGSQQQYTDLGQVELDIKIDKKYRVKEID